MGEAPLSGFGQLLLGWTTPQVLSPSTRVVLHSSVGVQRPGQGAGPRRDADGAATEKGASPGARRHPDSRADAGLGVPDRPCSQHEREKGWTG